MTDDQISLLVIGTIIQSTILYFIIRFATGTPKKIRLMETQLAILIKIAEKAGITAEEIKKAQDEEYSTISETATGA